MRFQRFLPVLLCAVLVCSACSDDENNGTSDTGQADAADTMADAGEDADTVDDADAGDMPGPLDRTDPQPDVAPDGLDPTADLSAGEVRAGKITSSDTGFTGIWAHCKEGDFKLYNSDIAVCVEGQATNRMEMFTGGKLLDAQRVGGPTQDVLDGLFPLAGFGTMEAQSVEVIRDGSDGESAVIRVEGLDVPMAYVIGVIPGLFDERKGLEMSLEYRLEPDSDTIEMVTWYTNVQDGRRVFQIGDWFGWGDRARLWTPGAGFGALSSRYKWMGGVGEGHSYGWVVEESASDLGLQAQGLPFVASQARGGALQSGEEAAFRRWFVVGDGTLDYVRRRAGELTGDEVGGEMRTILVETEAGDPVEGKWVTVSNDDGALTAGMTDENGETELMLPSGELIFTVESWDGAGPVETTQDVDGTAVALELPTPGRIQITASDTNDEPMHTYVELRGDGNWNGVALDGEHVLTVEPGTYRVSGMHGPEWEGASVEVQVAAGEAKSADLVLEHSLNTDGWLSADFHQHMEPSPDSAAHIEARVKENVGLGVEFAVPTDHDVVSDLQPFIDALGLTQDIGTFSGVEISPLATHVGLYPMDYAPDERGRGTVALAVLEDGEPARRVIPEVVDIARTLESDPIVQLNHGRRDSSGMLELVGYDPEVGPDIIADNRFFTSFDTMEIVNRFENTCKLFRDWSGFLNYGLTPTGLANSDEHGLSGSTGTPRNYLMVDKAPSDVTEADIRGALRDGRVVAGANGFIEIKGANPGDLIESNGDPVDLSVRVQTPSWASATNLVTVVNGTEVDAVSASDDPARIEDFNETQTITVTEDAWVVFFAYGPNATGPTASGAQTVLFTNPVYIDVDGDTDSDGNKFEAPGLGTIDVPTVDLFCQ
ncbi:MAG: CehA/McbA family metallohydrolase [Myxococcota bacterium]